MRGRGVKQFQPHIGVFHAARVAGGLIAHKGLVAFALLALGAQAERQIVLHNRAGNHGGGVAGFLVAQSQAQRAFPIRRRVFRAHHHRSGHRVLAAHVALRPAQHFHLLHIPQRLGAESVFVVGGGTAVYRQVQTRPRTGEKRHRAHRRPRAVHTAHRRQIVAAAQIDGIDRLLEHVGGGKIVAAAVDIGRGKHAVAGGGFKTAAAGALARYHDFRQFLRVFLRRRRTRGIVRQRRQRRRQRPGHQ